MIVYNNGIHDSPNLYIAILCLFCVADISVPHYLGHTPERSNVSLWFSLEDQVMMI